MLLNKRPTRLDDATNFQERKVDEENVTQMFYDTTYFDRLDWFGCHPSQHQHQNTTEPNHNTKSKSNINEVPVVSDRVLRQRTVVLVTKPAGH